MELYCKQIPFYRYVWNQPNTGTGLRFVEIVTAEGELNLLPDIFSEFVTEAGIVVSDAEASISLKSAHYCLPV